jgi:tetratricopeptide (TPR) repeat protein
MHRTVLFIVIGFIAGLGVGFFAANSINRTALSKQNPAEINSGSPFANQQAIPANPGGAMLPDVSAVLEKASREPDNFDVQITAAQMYVGIANLEKAREYVDRAARVVPNNYDGSIKMANAYFDVRDFESAGEHYIKALEFKPDDVNAHTDLGTTYIERSKPDFEKGIAEFNEALRLDPKHEPTLYNLGIAYHRQGDAENARLTIARLEATNPSSPLLARMKERIK